MANEGSTKPTEEPFVTLSYGGTFTAKNVEDALRGAQAELDKANAELLRVRGLLQRQWISVNERMPDGINEFWCWIIPLPVDECPLNTSGEPITPNLNWSKPHADTVKTYQTKQGELRFNCGGLEKVTHWMPLPAPPNFPQSSSLVSQGAESADIGKHSCTDELCDGHCDDPDCPKRKRVEETMDAESIALAELALNEQARGSAETGGEKAAPEKVEDLRFDLAEQELNAAWNESGNSPAMCNVIEAALIVIAEVRSRFANFPRSSQNQTVSTGVEGAHESTTADKDDPHEIAKKIVEEHAWERASGGFYIDEVTFENLQIDIAEAIHDAGSREPEKLNNAQDEKCFVCGEWPNPVAGDPMKWPVRLPFASGNGKMRTYCTKCVVEALAESSPSSPPPNPRKDCVVYHMGDMPDIRGAASPELLPTQLEAAKGEIGRLAGFDCEETSGCPGTGERPSGAKDIK